MRLIKKLANSLVLLSVTAFPGLTRLVFLVLIEKIYGAQVLGSVVSDLSIVNMLVFFSATGWCALLISRAANSKNLSEGFGIFNGFLLAASPFFPLFALLIVILFFLSLVHFPLTAVLYLFGYSVYMFLRHFYLGVRRLYTLFVVEISVLVLGVLFLLAGSFEFMGADKVIPLSYFLVIFPFVAYGMYYLYRLGQPMFIRQISVAKNSMLFGFSNLAGGGIYMLLVPLSLHFLSKEYAAFMGLSINLTTFLTLFSRALTNHYLPLLSSTYHSTNRKDVRKVLKSYRLAIIVAVPLLAVILYLFVVIMGAKFFPDLYNLPGVGILFGLLMTCVVVGQLFLPDNSFLVVLEKGTVSAKLNALVFIGFLGAVGIAYSLNGDSYALFVIALSSLASLQLLKGIYLIWMTTSALKEM